ncbi:MAG: hypothetical protein ACHQ6V_15520 [Myxococcota bacterium]
MRAPRAPRAPQLESVERRTLRVGFLFNHDHIHQVAHSAPIAFELARSFPDVAVTLLVAGREQEEAVRALAHGGLPARCEVQQLHASGPLAWIDPVIGSLLSFRRLAVLGSNAAQLDRFDALVVPEKTTLRLRTHYGARRVKLIHTRHGAGDRAVGFDAESRHFDLALLSGEKIRARLAAAGALPPRFAIVGYPKFDAVDPDRQLPHFFANHRPTVLYNPHFSPHYSSWYDAGREILEFFHRSRDYNLIFAPHVMLFRRRLQLAVEKLALRWVPGVPRRYAECEHIHVDLGSAYSTDMTYTQAADVYLGDVSSQVCEFIARPRPCVFANPRRVPWQGDPSYAMWRLGTVFERVEDLPAALERAIHDQPLIRSTQEAYARDTFDLREQPSSRRAAQAIHAFLTTGAAEAAGASSAPRDLRAGRD